MKLASFRAADSDRIGVVLEGGDLLDLTEALRDSGVPERALPRTMLALIESESITLSAIQTAVDRASADSSLTTQQFASGQVTWLPPVRRPSKICCLALNNSANSDRILKGPKHPAMFIKPASALVGHGGAIECKPQYGSTWPGDIVSMGTALARSSCGGAVQNIDLNKLGGPVTVSIERIGTLTNPVAQVKPA